VQLVQRYRNGIRGRLRSCVQDLLKQYIDVEQHFQAGTLILVVIRLANCLTGIIILQGIMINV